MRQMLPHPELLLIAGLSLASGSGAAQNIPSDVEAYGEVYPAACKPTERKVLKASLDALREPDTQKLWQAIHTLLCAPAIPANERLVKQVLASRVKTTDEDTGSASAVRNPPATLELAQELMAKGEAWRATIESRDEGIVLQYAPNEACIASITFVHRGKKWWISQTGSACD